MPVSHILIVDDDLALLQALPSTITMRMDQVNVETTSSSREALNLIAATDYDAILTDIRMPGLDGLALLSRIRAVRPMTPVLLMTGHGDHELAGKANRLGAHAFLQKPLNRDCLMVELKRALEIRRLSRHAQDTK